MFRLQRARILAQIRQKSTAQIHTKDESSIGWLPTVMPLLETWVRWLFDQVRPLVGDYAREAADRFWTRLVELRPGIIPPNGPPVTPPAAGNEEPSKPVLEAAFAVMNPRLNDAVDRLTLAFCEETQQATSLELSEALAATRAAIREGTVEGLAIDELTRRVNAVFDEAEQFRAKRIAVTEASRAVHLAQDLSAQESGVVWGFEWLASADACPRCLALAGKRVPLGTPFVTDASKNPAYATVYHPPLHPHDQCTLLEILNPE